MLHVLGLHLLDDDKNLETLVSERPSHGDPGRNGVIGHATARTLQVVEVTVELSCGELGADRAAVTKGPKVRDDARKLTP